MIAPLKVSHARFISFLPDSFLFIYLFFDLRIWIRFRFAEISFKQLIAKGRDVGAWQILTQPTQTYKRQPVSLALSYWDKNTTVKRKKYILFKKTHFPHKLHYQRDHLRGIFTKVSGFQIWVSWSRGKKWELKGDLEGCKRRSISRNLFRDKSRPGLTTWFTHSDKDVCMTFYKFIRYFYTIQFLRISVNAG